jgi:hypothetical protein
MVYSNRFVLSVLLNGNILQERKDGVVPVPMYQGGTEYGLRFRNRHGCRAVVKFTIDGEDASGGGFVVPANGHVDIFRYHHKDAKFKFVSLDSTEAADFGKSDNLDGGKGVIEARFYLEKQPPKVQYVPQPYPVPYPVPQPYPVRPGPHYWRYPEPKWYCWDSTLTKLSCGYHNPRGMTGAENAAPTTGKGIFHTVGGDYVPGCDFTASCPVGNVSLGNTISAMQVQPPRNDTVEGCTVEGAASGQNFHTTYIDLEDDFALLKVVLRGVKAEQAESLITEITHCTQCGAKRGRKTDKFCGACGTKF